MFIVYIVSGLFFFMGIGIKYFKWDFLIAGYNTMSKKQKENVDRDGLCSLTGNFLFLMGLVLLGAGMSEKMGYRFLTLILTLSIFPLTILVVILGQKYDHNKDIKSKKTETRIIAVVLIIITISMTTLFVYGSREPKIDIMPDRIVISGIYGTMIKKDKITEITLEDNIPKVLNKVNGFDLGYILRGIFKLEGLGTGSIYIRQKKAPYILIKTENKYFLINYKDSNKTIDLYNKLK